VSFEAPRYQLYAAFKALREHWGQVQDQWRDPVRQDFEEHYWNALEPTTLAALSAIDGLAQALLEARRECS
jgi:hypothetical protein